jgi:hypothetical protein
MSRRQQSPLRTRATDARQWRQRSARAPRAPATHDARATQSLAVAAGHRDTEAAKRSGRRAGDAVAHLAPAHARRRRQGRGPGRRAAKNCSERAYRTGEQRGLAVWPEEEAGPVPPGPVAGHSWEEQGPPRRHLPADVSEGTAQWLPLCPPQRGSLRARGVHRWPTVVRHGGLQKARAVRITVPRRAQDAGDGAGDGSPREHALLYAALRGRAAPGRIGTAAYQAARVSGAVAADARPDDCLVGRNGARLALRFHPRGGGREKRGKTSTQ